MGTALAGAWTLPKGTGIAIVQAGVSRSDGAFGSDRHSAPSSGFRKAEIQALAEYGITDRFTLRGRTEWRQLRFEDREPATDTGFGVSEIGGRFRLVQRGGFVASVEANLRLAEADAALDPMQAGLLEGEYEARLLAGYGFTIAGRSAFVDAQGAFRERGAAKADEVRADVTLGVRPWSRFLVLAQSFSVFGLSDETSEGYDQHKLQLSGVYDVTPRVSLQLGGWSAVAGRNALDEEGVLTALWVRF
ncbi:hypothetical protein [Aureimonas sp. ME7]|uniref:hypothetical protein n=1 Tax=Aureimonas sp. ME7 TaxID=2744252 RepID=UPI0015F5A20B|nr:hypothetical protein [Aureimonas sp. ME7]